MITTKTYPAPPVCKHEILRYAGVREDAPEWEAQVEEILGEVLPLLSYRVCYTVLPVAVEGDCVDLGFVKSDSTLLRNRLAGCDQAVVFAATVGVGIDRLIARAGVLAPSKALLLQAVGAERIEALCDALMQDMATSHSITGRFSPGYGDLPLEMQRKIFDLLEPPKHIGLTLNDSLLMSPTKSVTAIFGMKESLNTI